MIIDIILGPYCSAHRPIDFAAGIYTNDRGLTGSDLIFVEFGKAFKKLGYEVNLFTSLLPNQPKEWEGCNLYDYSEILKKITKDHFAAISISEPEVLRGIPDEVIKIHSHQLNGFDYCQKDWESLSHLKFSPSLKHLEYHKQWISPEHLEDWHVVPDGCDPENFTVGKKIPGKMVSISSVDRGLHWLLSMYPEIKKQVPELNLTIFYHFNPSKVEDIEFNSTEHHCNIIELGSRYRYLLEAIKKLEPLGVKLVGSANRKRIAKELNETMVGAFSCDTIRWSEGFSISCLEFCLHQCAPVISDCDALGEIYQHAATVVPCNFSQKENQKIFIEAVVRSFKDEEYRNEINAKSHAFAVKNSWDNIAKQIENIVQEYKLNKEKDS